MEGENTMEKGLRVFRGSFAYFSLAVWSHWAVQVLMKRDITAWSYVNKHDFAHARYARIKFHRDFRFVFWEMFNSELLYFIHLIEILTILDQRSAVSLTQ